jgi:outer membrane protein OmpA-like peptidoglycan-associated protein
MDSTIRIWAPVVAGLVTVVSACSTAGVPPPKQQPPAELQTPAEPGEQTFRANWPVLDGFAIDPVRDRAMKNRQQLNVAKELREACKLPDLYFDFDSVEVQPEERAGLERLAACFTQGPLRDRRIKLIGRADRQGDASYNLALGMRRAEHVKRVLIENGMPPVRVLTSSRGETAVLGPFEGYTYADDRRVDVLISQ